jgi:hypothetical protein
MTHPGPEKPGHPSLQSCREGKIYTGIFPLSFKGEGARGRVFSTSYGFMFSFKK